jgi:nucleotide-binding universal stress UspA family protein
MFKKALVATDLSPASDRVVEYAAALRALGCEDLVLAHVVSTSHTMGLRETLQAEEAPQLVARQQQRLAAMGFSVTAAISVGKGAPVGASIFPDNVNVPWSRRTSRVSGSAASGRLRQAARSS